MNLYQRLLEIERRQTQIERYRAELGASIQTADQDLFNMDSGEIALLVNGGVNNLIPPYDLVTTCELRLKSVRVWSETTGNTTFLWDTTITNDSAYLEFFNQSYNAVGRQSISNNPSRAYLFDWTTLDFTSLDANGVYRFNSAYSNRTSSELVYVHNGTGSFRYFQCTKSDQYTYNDYSMDASSTSRVFNGQPLKAGTSGVYTIGTEERRGISGFNDAFVHASQPSSGNSLINGTGPSDSTGLQIMSTFEVRW